MFLLMGSQQRRGCVWRQVSRALVTLQSSASDTSGDGIVDALAASRWGLDPSTNRFHAPIAYHERYSFEGWPSSHTFSMDKFRALSVDLTTWHQDGCLPRPLVRSYEDFFRPLDLDNVPHGWFSPLDAEYLRQFLEGELSEEECRYIGFREHTRRPELIERTVLEVAGTILAAQLAHRFGIASNCAGGTHHARHNAGRGYTILNDLALTANFLTDPDVNGGSVRNVERVLVVDLDVHQGDGTALFDLGGQRLSTLSLHCASNYPTPKAHSTYDVGLPDGCGDDDYMRALEEALERAFGEVKPDFVLYDAGVDVYKEDRLGRLHVSMEGMRRRDRYVLDYCVQRRVPVAAVIGGGYDKDLQQLARRHAVVHEECAYIWRKYRLWERVPTQESGV